MTGLLSSFLTAYCIFPLLKVPAERKVFFAKISPSPSTKIKLLCQFKKLKFLLLPALPAACIAVLIISPYGMKLENDIRSLYTMSGPLMESEIKTAQVLDLGSQSWYFIVSGDSRDELLENEEKLTLRLEKEVSSGKLGSFLGTSVFVPSVSSQKKTYELMKALLPLAPTQFEYLGLSAEDAENFAAAFYEEFTAGERYCYPEDAPAQAGISSLWIGEAGGKYYSCVLPFHAGNEDIFRALAAEFEFVHFISKANDIGRDLDTLTRTIILAFLAAYLIVSVIVFVVYPRNDSLRICGVPVFLGLSALALLALNKIPLGFFSIAALVLVFGLGLDYIVYMIGGKSKKWEGLTRLAVLLSFLTTLLSFGALAFSSFVPVHVFGLTVSGGLAAAFISAMLLTVKKD
jgi:predicted exporter